MMVGAGKAGSEMDVSNILKPALARGQISCIGATTYKEYRQTIEKDDALARRFGLVKVGEPSLEETHDILMGIRRSHGYCWCLYA